MPKKKFKWLLPEKLPSLVYKRRVDYDECIEEFLNSYLKSAWLRFQMLNQQANSLY